MIMVKAPSRIHLGLLDLGRASPRTFGGIGFVLDEPGTQVTARIATSLAVSGDISRAERAELEACIRRLFEAQDKQPGISIEVLHSPPAHIGMGRRTALTLACLAAASTLVHGQVDRRQLQMCSGRGGTSGIGVNGFFLGGFVFDGGHKGELDHLPSAYQQPVEVPPVLAHFNMPVTWKVVLFTAGNTQIFGLRERDLFQAVTPLPVDDVHAATSLVALGMLPALAEGDLSEFGASYEAFSRLGMKAREIEAHGPDLASALAYLAQKAPCCGMSSMGPTVFAIYEGDEPDFFDLPAHMTYLGRATPSADGYFVQHA